MKLYVEDFGIVCALGRGRTEVAAKLAAHDTGGMKRLDRLVGGDATVFGFAPGWGPDRPAELAPGEPRVGRLIDVAADEITGAVERAKAEFGADRIGVVMGSSNSTMEEFTDTPDRIDMGYPSEHLKARLGVTGPQFTVSTACSSSAKVFSAARRLLDGGAADAVVVGGADAYTRTVVEGFHALEALSPTLCRPLAEDRDGINLGEGCALFLLRRDATGKPSVTGCGESSDAYHLTAPDPEGKGAEASMRAALADAGLAPADVDFVNLHGTGTVYNDSMEMAAVGRVFGGNVAAFSTKMLTGHCLGAAGAIEAALTLLLLKPGQRALSNSFAFGGSDATVAFEGILV